MVYSRDLKKRTKTFIFFHNCKYNFLYSVCHQSFWNPFMVEQGLITIVWLFYRISNIQLISKCNLSPILYAPWRILNFFVKNDQMKDINYYFLYPAGTWDWQNAEVILMRNEAFSECSFFFYLENWIDVFWLKQLIRVWFFNRYHFTTDNLKKSLIKMLTNSFNEVTYYNF